MAYSIVFTGVSASSQSNWVQLRQDMQRSLTVGLFSSGGGDTVVRIDVSYRPDSTIPGSYLFPIPLGSNIALAGAVTTVISTPIVANAARLTAVTVSGAVNLNAWIDG